MIPYLNAKISAIKGLLPKAQVVDSVEELISLLRESPYGPYIEKYASAYSGIALVSIAGVRFFSDVMGKLRRAMPSSFLEEFDAYTDVYLYNSIGLVLMARQTKRPWREVEPYLIYKTKADLGLFRRLLEAKDVRNELRRSRLGKAIFSLQLSQLNDMEKRIFLKAKDDVERQVIYLFTFYTRRYLLSLIPRLHPSLGRAIKEGLDVGNIVRLLRGLERGLPFKDISHTFYKGGILSLEQLEEAYKNPSLLESIMARYGISSKESYRAEIEGERYMANLYRGLLGELTLKPERAIAFLQVLNYERRNIEAIAKALWFGVSKEEIKEVLV